MSKQLYLIRHAKSSWKDSSIGDHDRPLNKRGRHDAPLMAQIIKDSGVSPDMLISSTALRALSTAKAFAEVFGFRGKDIQREDSLYMGWQKDFIKCIEKIDDINDCVFIFSHNPGITDFANSLCHTNILNIPTCGIFHSEIETDSWKKAGISKARFISLDYPKNHYTYFDED